MPGRTVPITCAPCLRDCFIDRCVVIVRFGLSNALDDQCCPFAMDLGDLIHVFDESIGRSKFLNDGCAKGDGRKVGKKAKAKFHFG